MRIAGALSGRFGIADQVHARLGGRAPSLAPVAGDAAGNDVLPVLPAAVRDRHDVIERQLRRREHLTAVLTRVVVSRVDVGARERNVINRCV